MDKEVAVRDSVLMRGGIAALVGLLLAVTVWSAAGREDGAPTLVALTAVPFALVAATGLSRPVSAALPRRVTWLTVLSVLWIVLAVQEATAAYLAIALFALYLYLLPTWWGVMATGVVTVIAAGLSVAVAGPSTGAVLGPVLSGLVAMVIGVTVEGLYVVSEDRRRLIDELVRTRRLLAESERQAGVVEERERLAHEIHDTVAQGLSSIQMLLHAAERDVRQRVTGGEPPVERVIQARDVAADSLRETRAMIAALQPSDLDGGSLVDALGRLAESASGETGETGEAGDGLTVSVESGDGAVELPIAVEAVLLRVAQSAVANVRQHAGASRALITLSTNPEAVRLDIVDDGSGFDLAAVQATLAERAEEGHIGLVTMRRRVEELGGTLVVESAVGSGTAVAVEVPLPHETPRPVTPGL
ncbi:two-component sensor histidine kinase [Corynebacterium sp. CNJ-954]|uniref:sensor histidine kinase n=1 Tax=Corynebacterium sp. CNJ-954 TaxID=1904962 RepID=UPI00095E11A1|nr:sensor histidine kinase [Corynebacterium sp. CNJ-954]OLT54107.1 two-component sensor histidine kinase [Corynebacterium sp. CNJ-954]